MPILVGAFAAVVISLLIGASIWGILGYAIFGAIAGWSGGAKLGSVETYYWVMLLILAVLLGLKFFGAPISGFVVFLPVIMIITRLISAWTTALVARVQN